MPNLWFPALILTTTVTGCAHGPTPPTSKVGAAPGAPPSAAANQATAAPLPAPPDPTAAASFLAAVRAGDLAAVQQRLGRDPALTAARTEGGTSAVQVALFRIQDNQEDFYPPAANPILQAVLAAHPALDPYETAAVGDAAVLARLIGADPALVSRLHPIGWTVLHYAAFGGNAAAVRLLLDHGAALEQVAANKFGNTPLHVALLTGDHATVELLVERGANLEARYDGGTTPLHLAAALGRVDLLTVLLAHGAAIDARSDAGATALSIAIKSKRLDAAELLRRRGAHT